MSSSPEAEVASTSMSAPDQAFDTLRSYFEDKSAPRRALGGLRAGVEIGVTIGSTVDCALLQQNGQPKVERRKATNPDFVFAIRPETVYVLAKHPSDEVGEVGVAVLKEMLAGNVSVRFTGSLMSVLSNGYLEVIKRGGSKFAASLAAHGLNSASRVTAAIRRMRA